MSSDKENEYFSDGITEEILNALSKIEGLHVTARTSSFAFKGQNLDAREIGRRLNVALLLEGSTRKAGSKVRITAQLIKAEDGYHIWSDSWDRELKDIFILQDEIAALIAEKVNSDLTPEKQQKEYVVEDEKVIDLYLKANYIQNQWDFKRSKEVITLYEKVISIDPKFSNAYIGLCHMYTWLSSTGYVNPMEAQQKVDYYVNKAMELDKNLPDIYMVISGKKFWMEWNIPEAIKNINRAIELKPSYAEAFLSKGLTLIAQGNTEEALDAFFQSERLNPLYSTVNYCIGLTYNYNNESQKALDYIEKNIKIAPYWYAQYIAKIEALCKLNRFKEAWKTIEMLEKDANNPLNIDELKGFYYSFSGEKEKASVHIAVVEEKIENDPIKEAPAAAILAGIFLNLDEIEKALHYVELGVQYRSAPLLFVKIDSMWDKIRSAPRFINAMKAIQFIEDAKTDKKPTKKYRKSSLSASETDQLEQQLKQWMKNEKPYLNPRLTLSDLAESIDISTNLLSQLLNEYLGKNFYDYVNTYRLDYFLDLYKDPKYKNFTLLGLAYEAGFNSKTTFNAFFKKEKGKTPSEYFKADQK